MSRKVLYLEPVGGIAGDMFLACAFDLGVNPEDVLRALSGLKLGGWKFSPTAASRHAIHGTHLDVEVDPAAEKAPQRSLTEIRGMIQGASSLSERARGRALAMFECVGRAEAHIHQVPLEEIHFHEVGAIDSIVVPTRRLT